MKFINQYGYLIASVLFLFSGILNVLATNRSLPLVFIYFLLAVFFFNVYQRENKKRK